MIPVCEPLIKEREIEYVTECLRSGWVSSAGHFITDFEERWAAYCGRKYGVAVSNGTVALQLAVASLHLKPGDEIIMPTFTIISCALAAIYNKCVPVLVDADPTTWCMDVSQIESKITSRTKAIMPVHIYGHPTDMDPLLQLSERYGLAIVEDAAEAHGAECLSAYGASESTWRRCGSFGVLSCFSFYANKLITTGEGGMILTDSTELAERLRSMRNLCFQSKRRFDHKELGYNFRLTNIQAALGLGQMERFPEIVENKRWMGQEYLKRLRSLKGLQLPTEEKYAKSVYWMFGIVLDRNTGFNAETLAKELEKFEIETRPFFLGMHEQEIFHKMGLFKKERYPVAELIAKQGLYLPSGLSLKQDQISYVVNSIKQLLNHETKT